MHEENSTSKVLLIDDCEDQLAVLELLLSKSGFDVVIASTAEKGMEMLRSGDFDVVVSDVFMPGRNSKQLSEFISEVKNRGNLPFIALSAASPELEQEMLAAGADLFIHKRDMKRQLAPAIRELLALQENSQELLSAIRSRIAEVR